MGNITSVVDTNIQSKEKNFSKFTNEIIIFEEENRDKLQNNKYGDIVIEPINAINSCLSSLASIDWFDIAKEKLYFIFCLSYIEWKKQFSKNPGKDTDTWNEEKKG